MTKFFTGLGEMVKKCECDLCICKIPTEKGKKVCNECKMGIHALDMRV